MPTYQVQQESLKYEKYGASFVSLAVGLLSHWLWQYAQF